MLKLKKVVVLHCGFADLWVWLVCVQFTGTWYLTARLRNSPSPEAAMLRLSANQDRSISVVYFAAK